MECPLSEGTVERHFTDQGAYPTPPRGYADNDALVSPITVKEVKTALFKMKTKGAVGHHLGPSPTQIRS